MHGTKNIRFSAIFADTLKTLGFHDTYAHYVIKHDMPRWEFHVWYNSVKGV